MSLHQISLGALLSRDVAVQWFEGVALVQTVCRQVADTHSAVSGFPLPSRIVLSRDGSVTIMEGSETGSPVEGAARLLAELNSEDAPVQLRLLLSQATAANSAYSTLAQFSGALAYFERSGSQTILQQLFERAEAAKVRQEDERPSTPPAVPVETLKPQERSDLNKRQRAAAQPLVAVVAVVALLSVAAWFLLVGSGRGHLAAASTSVMSQLGLGVPGTADNAAAASSEPIEKAAANKASAASGKSPGQRPASRDNHRGTDVHTSTTSLLRPSLSKTPGTAGATLAEWFPGSPSAELVPPVLDGVVTYIIPATPADPSQAVDLTEGNAIDYARVYSATDSQVIPPRHVYPTFPEPAADVELRHKTVVDFVVAGNGLVERVRLRRQPRDIHEFMLLSAAKAWRFEPATLGGRPVRFLHSLTIVRQ